MSALVASLQKGTGRKRRNSHNLIPFAPITIVSFYIYHYTSTPSLRGLCARVGQRRAATTPGTSCPTLLDKCVGSLTSHEILELKEL